MRIEELTLREVRDVYQKRMTVDFPRHELKYLSTIEDSIGKGRYRCLGLKDAGELLAYAFFVCLTVNGEEHWLLDYYAIDSNHRGEGIGSRFLRMLCGDYLQGAGCALLEVDDPACACDEAERETRERRLQFYLRNGMTDTGVRANVFEADFMILRMPVGNPDQDYREIYRNIYRVMLPKKLFDTWVRMK